MTNVTNVYDFQTEFSTNDHSRHGYTEPLPRDETIINPSDKLADNLL